ncbi:MAG TPA: hypothetical protein VLF14_01665 [Candidatus Binatia bacterium]|nr:hypothetical protein [Candidatus Binatia bacterium]
MRNWKGMTVLGCTAILFATALEAQAAGIRVRCATQVDPPRSKISIDGRNLGFGQFRAVAKSGTNRAGSPLQGAVGGEAEFDFDSDPGNIQAGATPIDANFIQNNRVVGKIFNSSGVVVRKGSATCTVQ